MSVKQSRNVDRDSESEEQLDVFYSEDIQSRVAQFNQHAAEISVQIDDLIAAGCEVIENLRRRFVDRLESVKEELLNGVQSQNREWEENSKKSREELERLISIKELVKSLGLTS